MYRFVNYFLDFTAHNEIVFALDYNIDIVRVLMILLQGVLASGDELFD